MKKIFLTLIATTLAMASSIAQDSVIIPRPLRPGSKIAIVTPSSHIYDKYLDGGTDSLRAHGFEPVIMPYARGREFGSYPYPDSLRAQDLMAAFTDPEIDAIMCSRGGYGAIQLYPYLDIETIKANPKWLIGFSDITALHALLNTNGIASIHGPMCSHLTKNPATEASVAYLYQLLQDSIPLSYSFEPQQFNIPGSGTGRLLGGNMLVASGLAQTPYDVLNPDEDEDVILFLEDVGEKIYAIERMLIRLHESGALKRAKGLIIGEFTEYAASEDFPSMEAMISYWLTRWGYQKMPVMFGMPSGHDDVNYPLLMGAKAALTVTPEGSTLTMGIE